MISLENERGERDVAQEQLNKIEEQLQNHLELSRDEFRSALRTNASVLFLGQKYQTDFYGEEYFLQAASKVLDCLKGAAVLLSARGYR